MKIFIIRHAEAISYETETVQSDEYRFVTSNGRIISGKVAKHLKDKFSDLEKIFTSPLTRAVQTAEIFAVRAKFKGDVEPVNEMKNESTTASLQEMIKNNSQMTSIALVGHEPKLGVLVKAFCGLKELKFEFGKSGVCLVDYDIDKQEGKLIWYFDPGKMEFVN